MKARKQDTARMDLPQHLPVMPRNTGLGIGICGAGESRRWESIDFAETWFPDAFIGPMSSLMRVVGGEIEEAETSVRDNLETLRLVFGAYKSMESGAVVQLADTEQGPAT